MMMTAKTKMMMMIDGYGNVMMVMMMTTMTMM